MLKKVGLPMMALGAMLVLGAPKAAKAQVGLGVQVGPSYAAPYSPYCSVYDPYNCPPYVYSYPYAYPYVYGGGWGWGGGWHGDHDRGFRGGYGYGGRAFSGGGGFHGGGAIRGGGGFHGGGGHGGRR
ncbi:MAG TPA: hypothetical protein VKB88_04750 [Bryobacteraceae bacterium]|nr:hypothetical protein [Bryobacteraceae bacterium]